MKGDILHQMRPSPRPTAPIPSCLLVPEGEENPYNCVTPHSGDANMKTKIVGMLLAALALAAGTARAAEAAAPPADKPLRVLFIGNSLTYYNNLPNTFASVVASAEPHRPVEVAESTFPGAGLRRHWDGEAKDRIREARWDYVVVQGGFNTTPSDHVKLFDAEIRKAGAKTVLFVTWARKGDAARQQVLDEAFAKAAKDLGILAAPIGSAWVLALKKDRYIDLYDMDGLHPGPMGTYIAACVIYSAITGRPVPVGEATGATAIAREVAWQATQEWATR